jgi:hypothetical protein
MVWGQPLKPGAPFLARDFIERSREKWGFSTAVEMAHRSSAARTPYFAAS